MDLNSSFKIPEVNLEYLKKFIINECTVSLSDNSFPVNLDISLFSEKHFKDEESIFQNFLSFLVKSTIFRVNGSPTYIQALFLIPPDKKEMVFEKGKYHIKITRSPEFENYLKALQKIKSKKIENFFVYHVILYILMCSDRYFMDKYGDSYSSLNSINQKNFKLIKMGIENFDKIEPQDCNLLNRLPDFLIYLSDSKITTLGNFCNLYNRNPQVFLFLDLLSFLR